MLLVVMEAILFSPLLHQMVAVVGLVEAEQLFLVLLEDLVVGLLVGEQLRVNHQLPVGLGTPLQLARRKEIMAARVLLLRLRNQMLGAVEEPVKMVKPAALLEAVTAGMEPHQHYLVHRQLMLAAVVAEVLRNLAATDWAALAVVAMVDMEHHHPELLEAMV